MSCRPLGKRWGKRKVSGRKAPPLRVRKTRKIERRKRGKAARVVEGRAAGAEGPVATGLVSLLVCNFSCVYIVVLFIFSSNIQAMLKCSNATTCACDLFSFIYTAFSLTESLVIAMNLHEGIIIVINEMKFVRLELTI